ncbi:MAG: CcmD family protein [Bacteroidota bacterium]|jgi:CcmD family protein|nr:CcmD family protein [Bacteroidota bacterium]NBX64412.1 CcmD family protein [Bacteroidota bacterium]
MKQTITEQFDANAAELLAQHNLMNAVYAVLTIIFVGILLYLFRLDRKISKIEKNA